MSDTQIQKNYQNPVKIHLESLFEKSFNFLIGFITPPWMLVSIWYVLISSLVYFARDLDTDIITGQVRIFILEFESILNIWISLSFFLLANYIISFFGIKKYPRLRYYFVFISLNSLLLFTIAAFPILIETLKQV